MTATARGRTGGALPYTPSRQSGAVLDARTVGRDALLDLLAARFTTAARSKNRIHTLLVGPRGSGKSHLVEVALHRLRQDETLRERFAVVVVPEDGLAITRFTDIVDLARRDLGGTAAGLRRQRSHWSQVTELLGERVLLLVVENLDRLFRALGEAGQRDLRAWVETSGEVLLLATTPLLTAAVTSRDQPWFGGFAVDEVVGLTAEEGRELLRRTARERGDRRLEDFLAGPTGHARVQSVAQLTGGSPRVWTMLADRVSAESLDDLVPAVQDLLEGLVPYYQQLLWDLAPNEQRIVKVLAEGPYGALSVGEIAEHAGLEERTTASSLGRLRTSRWVSSEKPGVGDARRVLYRLREPMLRHHVQYRGGDRSTLLLVVELLRGWFDRSERTARPTAAPADSMTMRHLAESFRSFAGTSSSDLDAYDLTSLPALARRWLAGEDAATWGPAVGGALVRASGDLDHALRLATQLAGDAEATLGPDHPDTLWSRIGLAEALRRAGRTAQALDMAVVLSADLGERPDLVRQRHATRRLLDTCIDQVIGGTGEAPEEGIVGLFAQALRGDAEALVRLPSELRDLAERHLQTMSGTTSKDSTSTRP